MGKPILASQEYCVEDHLCSFENQWNKDREIDFAEFLPDATHPEFLSTLTELVRIDMELSYGAGNRRMAEDYFARHPQLSDDRIAKSEIAFEEFRLRNINKERIHPEAIASKYDVSMLNWPDVDFTNGVATTSPAGRSGMELSRGCIPQPGDKFENFRIIGRLGEGAFGTVMLAQQDDLAGRLTVLKFVPSVSREHDFLARLQHTNIVPIFSIHGSDEFNAICMPFMGIATLQDLNHGLDTKHQTEPRCSTHSQALIKTINQNKEKTVENSIPDSDDLQLFQHRKRARTHENEQAGSQNFLTFATELIASVASGLGYAHDRGIVHGDLKPANVLLDDDSNPIILDFHLANSASEGLGSHVGGTLAYMAPEHLEALKSDTPVDCRTDIYSAGVMLFELATGRLPFEVQNSLDDIIQCRRQPVSISSDDQKVLGPDLVAIVSKCLEPNPAMRYQNGYELEADLRAGQQNLPLVHAKEVGWLNRARKWSRRHPRITSISTVATVAIILTALLVAWLWQLNHKIRVADAVAKSGDFVAALSEARIPLTSLVLDDKQHFELAVQEAEDALQIGGWNNAQTGLIPDRTALLNAEQFNQEKQAVSELYFWMAAGILRNVDMTTGSVDREALLKQAFVYNQSAKEIRGGGEFIGIESQESRINDLRSGKKFELVPEWSKLEGASRSDRVMYSFLGRRDYQNALNQLNQLVEEDPLDFLAWMQMGQTYYLFDNHDLAQACFTICIALDPENSYPKLYRAMSKIKANDGNLDSAIDDLHDANRLSPNLLCVIQNLGLAHGMNGDFAKAKDYYDQAIEMGTQNTRTWFLRSRVNKRLGNETQAASDLEYFMATEPSDVVSWRTRGTQQIATSPKAAAHDFVQALQLSSRDVTSLNNLAHVYSEKLNDLPQAIKAMDRVVDMVPQNVRYRAARGVLLARNDQRDAAIKDAERCINQDKSADTLYRVSGIYAQTSRLDKSDQRKALTLLRQAVAKSPELVVRMMKSDPDLEPIKGHPEFQKILDLLEKMGFPPLK